MVFKFKINSTLCSGQIHLLYLFRPGNLIDFCKILYQFRKSFFQHNQEHSYLTDVAIEE